MKKKYVNLIIFILCAVASTAFLVYCVIYSHFGRFLAGAVTIVLMTGTWLIMEIIKLHAISGTVESESKGKYYDLISTMITVVVLASFTVYCIIFSDHHGYRGWSATAAVTLGMGTRLIMDIKKYRSSKNTADTENEQ